MAAVTTIIAGVGLAIGAAGALQQRKEQKKARKAQQRAADEQRKINAARVARERQQQIRAAIRKRAILSNQAGAQGLLGSSSSIGGISGVTSEAGGNIDFLNQVNAGLENISTFQQQAIDAQTGTPGLLNTVGSAVFNNAGTIGGFISPGAESNTTGGRFLPSRGSGNFSAVPFTGQI